MVRHRTALDQSDRVEKDIQRARRRNARIQLPQTPRCRIARIDEHLLAALLRLFIHLFEAGQRHEYLAAHLDELRW
jgi:hypothetical protein